MSQPSAFPIICVGASAGGLEAIELFFKSCPGDLGAAYIVIQHLSTQYKSMMDDLINRYSSMQVVMIEQNERPKPNTIYLIKAGTTVELVQGKFKVTKKVKNELTLPIDIFLQSLSQSPNIEKSVAVILSGTGSDGSRGAISLNASGGFVIAQTPEQAAFDGMPKNVINTGIVDAVRDAEAIPSLIQKYFNSQFSPLDIIKLEPKLSSVEVQDDYRRQILQELHDAYTIDFSQYKDATVIRRIERRMQVKHIGDIPDYLQLVRSDRQELLALRRELLIPVTAFFRDPEIFEFIASNVVQKVIEQPHVGDEIRVWIAGCSTGEEAYTYAMLFEHLLTLNKSKMRYKIFATDVNPDVIEFASKGAYPESIKQEIPESFIDEYFSQKDDKLTISQTIRQKVVFAVHNLLNDAAFTKMDVVSCRNTLIYFKNQAQKDVMQRLQFAVKTDGFLVLGKSESLTIQHSNFNLLDKRFKVFQCINQSKPGPRSLNVKKASQLPQKEQSEQHTRKEQILNEVESIAEAHLRREFLPLSLLVNEFHEVVHIYGENTTLLKLKAGGLSFQVSQIVMEPLPSIAVALLYRLNREDNKVSSESVILTASDGISYVVTIHGWRIGQTELPDYYLLSFEMKRDTGEVKQAKTVEYSDETAKRIEHLELELAATRESLQSSIEELETTNEELQATNEELMASNEELQSSNEELQSVNEELNTVNAEYHEKMSILNRINADLDAMSLSTGIATIFVDDKQNLTRFTPDASLIFKVREQDLGRPLNEIVNTLEYDSLFDDIALTITTGRSREIEILGDSGQGYLMRVVS